ncbi:PIN domain-containing protein [Antarcticimicrobium sediminis]|uniref:PIN domain-containing protein n=1 Tax=Antarcticimicrobium sediminis TaxID=2546227 RepID=A0A4R5EEZ4_9RHOB|nr:hypothetical protein [Antarcticimicrobium sediminis]TDE32925.1 hypothetical protein E1B25_21805 [Antarcticimicrobium sediminis]
MNFVFSTIKSWWPSNNQQSSQSAKVVGDNNSVDQSINIYVGDRGGLQKALSSEAALPEGTEWKAAIHADAVSDDGSEEFKLISKFREVANGGDSTTALKLLEGLKTDERFSDGFAAFRLSFNVGIVLQNIGEYEKASAALRGAHAFSPEHPKAKAGLALADLIDGRDEEAFEQAVSLLSAEGDHVNLCAAIAFNAAKRLKVKFEVEGYEYVDTSNEDIIISRLDYAEVVHPDQFDSMLKDAINADPENSRLKTTWAHAVLKDAQQNRAFLLGSKMAEGFEKDVTDCASILLHELECSLKQNPPNMLLLPSMANNAAVALRLNGRDAEASVLLDRVITSFPDLKKDLAQIRAALFLQQDKDAEAFQLIAPMQDQPEFQVMASEIEAQIGEPAAALERINSALSLTMPDGLRCQALAAKARIGISLTERNSADEAIDELNSEFSGAPELVLLRSAYSRAFELRSAAEEVESLPIVGEEKTTKDQEFLDSLEGVEDWEFFDVFQAANELFYRGFYRQSSELLRDRVSFSRESPALQLLCDSCMRGGMATLAREISESLSNDVQNSTFGWKFGANTANLTGEIYKAVPLTRKLFAVNPTSLSSLQWYVQSLLRMNDPGRIRRVVRDLNDIDLVGAISEKREYVNLLVFCGEIERARNYAYRLYCEHPNDHHSWMALSSSVLALGSSPTEAKDLWLTNVAENAAVEVVQPSGERRKYVLETDIELFPLRQENIKMDHPIAQALLHLQEGDSFDWPLAGQDGNGSILCIKHKALDAFHFVMQRFEEQFPDADGFSSVKCDPTKDDGLEEIMDLLRQRAQYGRQKISEYEGGSHPLALLGVTLGLDPIDTYLGIHREGGATVKVSSCKSEDQANASAWLKVARKKGMLLDALSIHLLRRLDLTDVVEQEFGKIGVTQNTIDIFARRLHEAITMGGLDDDGRRRAGSMSYQDGRIVMSEMSEEEIGEKVSLHQADLDWLHASCKLIPAVAKEDPADEIIRVRNSPGGAFLDDLFACDGSSRILVSDDLHLRQWGQGLFSVKGVWIQALLFHLEEELLISPQKVVSATIHLLGAGEQALSISSVRLLIGAEMMNSGELTEQDFQLLSSVIGQPGAEMASHIKVALEAINGLWTTGSTLPVKHRATSIILRNLVRHQGSNSALVMDTIQTLAKLPDIREYMKNWRIGHFIVHATPSEV